MESVRIIPLTQKPVYEERIFNSDCHGRRACCVGAAEGNQECAPTTATTACY